MHDSITNRNHNIVPSGLIPAESIYTLTSTFHYSHAYTLAITLFNVDSRLRMFDKIFS